MASSNMKNQLQKKLGRIARLLAKRPQLTKVKFQLSISINKIRIRMRDSNRRSKISDKELFYREWSQIKESYKYAI